MAAKNVGPEVVEQVLPPGPSEKPLVAENKMAPPPDGSIHPGEAEHRTAGWALFATEQYIAAEVENMSAPAERFAAE